MLAPPTEPRVTARLRNAAADGFLITALVGYIALLLRATLLHGGAMLGFDLFNYFFPAKEFASQALQRGALPLWNPAVFFGVPFLANVQMGVLYPPDLLFVLADFPRAVATSQWFHLSFGAAGMYLLCRHVWRLARLPSIAGALAFAGGGFFGAHMGHLNQVHAGVWLPWIALTQLSLARALVARPARRFPRRVLAAWPWSFAGGVCVALQLTAGHTQEAYYSLLALGLLAGAFAVFPPAWAPSRLAHLVALPLVTLNGALLAAAQLIPTLELSTLSYRQGGVSLEDAMAYGVERTYLLESLLPTFWSLPGQEVTGYVGVVALSLAIGAVASPARRTVVALAALALFAIAMTVGTYTPLFVLLHRWLPLFSSFRAPGRWLLVSTFALAGLAAHGLDALRYRHAVALRERSIKRFSIAFAAVGAGGVFFAWRSEMVHAVHWLPHARVTVLWLGAALGALSLTIAAALTPARWPAALVVCGLGLELAFAAREMEYNRPGPPDLYRHQSEVAQFLAGGEAPFERFGGTRTLSLAVEERLDPERLRRAVPDGDGEYRRYAAMREVVRPNLGVVYGLPTIDGYDGGLLPLKSYADFKTLLIGSEPPVPHLTLAPQAPARPNAPLLAALGVRYLLLDGRSGAPGPGWALREPVVSAAWLYENTDVAPRAFVVTDVRAEPDPQRALAMLSGLDLRRTAVVERPVADLAGPGSGAAFPPATSARILRYSAGALEVSVDGPGLLLMTETFYPGWRAAVDDRAAPVVRADLLFRGVAVPAGTHRVRVWYDPASLKLGFGLSALGLATNAWALWLCRRARRITP